MPAYEEEFNQVEVQGCKAAILQLGHGEENHLRTFLRLDALRRIAKEEPSAEHYELIHLKDLPKSELEHPKELCDSLYREFNADTLRPENYYGHSLSVSDVIVLFDGDDGFSCFYVDSIGFEKLSDDFLSEKMKNQIRYGLDVRLEHDTLLTLTQDMELPGEFQSRLETLQQDYEKIFSMADERGKILRMRETDPLFGAFPSFDIQIYDSSKEYFAVGKSSADETEFSIFGIPDGKPKLFEKGFFSLKDAIEFISELPEKMAYYKEHPVELVTMADLKEICRHKAKFQKKGLDEKIHEVKRKQGEKKEVTNGKTKDDFSQEL